MMNYQQSIEAAIAYIEAHLTEELDTSACAKAGGYSLYHFLRVFKASTGLTPAGYIRKRRLSEVAKELARGGAVISELAFRYGFNSKENFLRAFKQEHHILPTEYKATGNSLKLYERFCYDPAPFAVTPRLVTLDPIPLTVYPHSELAPTDAWNRYNVKGLSRLLSGGSTVKDYGVSVRACPTDPLRYFIGIETACAKGHLEGTLQLTIGGGLYAAFHTPPAGQESFVAAIHKTWQYVDVWLSQNSYRRSGGYEFECYTEASRLFSEEIYIPIEEDKQ